MKLKNYILIGSLTFLIALFFSQISLAKENSFYANVQNLNDGIDRSQIFQFLKEKITGNEILNKEKSLLIEPEVYAQLKEKENINVVVKLRDNFNVNSNNLEEIKEKSKNNINQIISLLGTQDENLVEDFEVLYRYESLNAFAGKINNAQLEILKNSELVESIYVERILQIALQESVPLINVTQVWNTAVPSSGNLFGNEQTICVVDTGIDYTHQALGGCLGTNCKVKGGVDFINWDFNPMDDNGHGTHVAGIVAANSSLIKGVAPNSKLIAVKSCNATSACPSLAMIAGIDYCISNLNSLSTDVITMSLGDGGQYNPGTCPTWMDFAVNFANSMNLPVVISSGNDAHKNGISYPACSPNAISVGSTYDANVGSQFPIPCTDLVTTADKVACYTNSGANLDVMAPGSIITSTTSSVGTRCGAPLSQGLGLCSGTSMAAPHVAGTIALIKQASPTITPAEIKLKLKQNGKSVTDTGNNLVFPRINAKKTIDSVLGVPWSPSYRMTYNSANSETPTIKIDSIGNAHLVWRDNRNGTNEVYYKKLDNNGNILINDTRISFSSSQAISSPNIAVDSLNNAFIVWSRNNLPSVNNISVYYSKISSVGNILINQAFIDNVFYMDSSLKPQIDIDLQNNIHITYIAFPSFFSRRYIKLDNTGNILVGPLSSPVSLIPTDTSIEIDNSGNVHLLYIKLLSGPGVIYSLRYTKLDNNGNTLISEIELLSNSFAMSYNSIKKDSLGNMHLIWENQGQIKYMKLNNNGGILISSSIVSNVVGSANSPKFTIDAKNNLHIVWEDNRNGQAEVYYEKRDVNNNVIVDDNRLIFTSTNSLKPTIDVDSNDELHISWSSNLLGNEIYYKRTMNNFNLEIPQTMSVGSTVPMSVRDSRNPNSYYLIGLSNGYSPGITLPDGRIVALNYDSLLLNSLSNSAPYSNFQGTLNNGRATGYYSVPNNPSLIGSTIYASFVTLNSTTFQTVAPNFPIQITA